MEHYGSNEDNISDLLEQPCIIEREMKKKLQEGLVVKERNREMQDLMTMTMKWSMPKMKPCYLLYAHLLQHNLSFLNIINTLKVNVRTITTTMCLS